MSVVGHRCRSGISAFTARLGGKANVRGHQEATFMTRSSHFIPKQANVSALVPFEVTIILISSGCERTGLSFMQHYRRDSTLAKTPRLEEIVMRSCFLGSMVTVAFAAAVSTAISVAVTRASAQVTT